MSTNATPTPAPLSGGLEQFGIPAITQHMIDAMQGVADANNKSAIINYNNALKSAQDNNAWLVSAGRPTLPLPTPPMLIVVNKDLITHNESVTFSSANPAHDLDWGGVFFQVPYVPPQPKTQSAKPITINVNAFQGPGLCGADGDGPSVPIGTKVQGPDVLGLDGGGANAATWTKIMIGRSPFAPGGIVTAWQQTG